MDLLGTLGTATIGAFIIRIGFGCTLFYYDYKESPK